MAKKFIIAADSGSLSAANREFITAFLERSGWEMWHWFNDVWLLAAVPDSHTPSTLAKDIQRGAGIEDSESFIVLHVDVLDFADGLCNKNAWKWLNRHFTGDRRGGMLDEIPIKGNKHNPKG